jgi:putative hydrolase of the HAD superfamily
LPATRAVIFDCYNTLVDIRTDERKAGVLRDLSLYMQYYGANISERTLRAAIYREKERFLESEQETYPEVDLEVIFRNILASKGLYGPFLAESCCKLFRILTRDRFQLFPESLPVLREMKGSNYLLGVVSDAQKSFTPAECRILGLHQFFDRVVLSSQYGFRKPDPRLFLIACALLGAQPHEAVFIGDHPEKDVKGPRQVGMPVILVDREGRDGNRETPVEPDFRARDLWEAWEWIVKKG